MTLLVPFLNKILGIFMITFSIKEEKWINKFNECIKAKNNEEEFFNLLDLLGLDINNFNNFVK